jgi:hypothetical protein
MTTQITSDNISSLSNMGVTWNAVTVADGSTQLSASAGNGYFLDTNVGVIEVFLPSSPSRGDTIILADYSGTFATNKVIINTGGKLIDSTTGGGSGAEFELTTNNSVTQLVFVDNDKGWLVTENEAKAAPGTTAYTIFTEATGGTVTTSGNYKIHTFTGDGNFVVSQVGNIATEGDKVDYLVVAGGGGGGSGCQVVNDLEGGGGGAGGLRFSALTYSNPAPGDGTAITLTATTYPITVGAGAAGSTSPPDNDSVTGGTGSNSVFSTITSKGGGGGGSRNTPSGTPVGGQPGGSGGGAGQADCETNSQYFGSGNTPPTSPSQGENGGRSAFPVSGASPGSSGGGGGGGAGQVGQNGFCKSKGGAGGAGKVVAITGSNVTYAGGGGGAGNPAGGSGGSGGGGNGALPGVSCGSANLGGGGGGGGSSPSWPGSNLDGGTGGKGVVILRYRYQA